MGAGWGGFSAGLAAALPGGVSGAATEPSLPSSVLGPEAEALPNSSQTSAAAAAITTTITTVANGPRLDRGAALSNISGADLAGGREGGFFSNSAAAHPARSAASLGVLPSEAKRSFPTPSWWTLSARGSGSFDARSSSLAGTGGFASRGCSASTSG